MSPVRPDLRHERALLRSGARVVVGMDEVGRGALAGPVSVGAVAVDLTTRTCPQGVADSKLLTAAARERLLPALGRWGLARAVGHASAAEIDAVGILAALRLAGQRALAGLHVAVDLVLLDGSHDWLTRPAELDLLALDGPPPDPHRGGDCPDSPVGGDWPDPLVGRDRPDLARIPRLPVPVLAGPPVAVRTRIKADRTCASVAAASVLAKCERDALMVRLAGEHPGYGWAENKGYGAPEHLEALRSRGPCILHRRSWRLPMGAAAGDPAGGPSAPEAADGGPRWSMMDA